MQSYEIDLGFMADDIIDQLVEQGYKPTDENVFKRFEKIRGAISQLYVCGYISHNTNVKCKQKLLKEIKELIFESGRKE